MAPWMILREQKPQIPETDPLKDDLRKFLWVVWHHLNLPEPTPIQYDIGRYLQHGPRRSIIEAFRGVGKSWLTAGFVAWLLYCNPQLKIMVVSASKDRSDSFSIFVKRLIHEIDILHFLRPKGDQRDSNIAFDVGPAKADQSPSVKSVGITGQLTGSRADVIIADDVEVPGNSMTQAQRDKLGELVKEFDAVLKPGGRIIYLGTPQCEMSLYNTLAERGYEARIWPARYPTEKQADGYKGKLAPFIIDRVAKGIGQPGSPTEPKRFHEADLLEREASYGRQGFALQFMLDTSLSDALRYPLKLSDIIVMSINREMAPHKVVWANDPALVIDDIPNVGLRRDPWLRPMWTHKEMTHFTGSVMAIDPSGRGNDETAYAVIKILNGQLFLTAAGGLLGGYEKDTLVKLSDIAAMHSVNTIVVEANFGDGMFTQLLKPVVNAIHPCRVEEVRHSKQKEQRIIDTLEPVLMQHRLVVDEKLIRQDWETGGDNMSKSLFYQLTRITRDRGALAHDDRLDALAMAVAYWVEHMARDVDKAVDQLKAKALEAELRSFAKHSLGRKPAKKGWIRV